MNKTNVFSRITSFFTTHPWLKLVSLLLAVIVWFYVKGERT
ncbi:MAG: hypothetical protein PHP73_02815 [Candidatus Omnitrophica bacterium]|nr:hypothetical protein [Candidatus Omnitrophota bacterium]